jgi:hypothetical protein
LFKKRRRKDTGIRRRVGASHHLLCRERRRNIRLYDIFSCAMTAAAAAYHDSLQRNYINNKTPCVPSALFFTFFFPFSKE